METLPFQALNQILVACAILAGFSYTIVVQLISMDKKDAIHSVTIGAFGITAAILTTALVVGTMYFFWLGGREAALREMVPGEVFVWSTLVGLLLVGVHAFGASAALLGWVYSKAMGIVTTIGSIFLFGSVWTSIFVLP